MWLDYQDIDDDTPTGIGLDKQKTAYETELHLVCRLLLEKKKPSNPSVV